jgi:DNA-binding NarL/FixJ family response regulator
MGGMDVQQSGCPVCAGAPSVSVAVAHRGLRELIVELLERDHGCWNLDAVNERADLAARLATAQPDLVIVDARDFPRCSRELLGSFPAERVVVIGPEPDPAYEHAARSGGAGAWLARDRVGEDLSACMRAALGCTHGPCPVPSRDRQEPPTTVPMENRK